MAVVVKNYAQILETLCDDFDEIIKPKKISRSNTNIIYLLLKAISKGLEIINNICVSLDNKFNPYNCSNEDLESVALIAGTKRKGGAKSGSLVSFICNNPQASVDEGVLIPVGRYYFEYEGVVFEYYQNKTDLYLYNTAIGDKKTKIDFMFLSKEKGNYPLEASIININKVFFEGGAGVNWDKSKFKVENDVASGGNNKYLGYGDENDNDFRYRLLNTVDRIDIFNELKMELLSLPYIYTCELQFFTDIVGNKYTKYGERFFETKPYSLTLFLHGDIENHSDEVARIIASKSLYPTNRELLSPDNLEEYKETAEINKVVYQNAIFCIGENGSHDFPIYYNTFDWKKFKIKVICKFDTNYSNQALTTSSLNRVLKEHINTNQYIEYITEDYCYNIIRQYADLTGVTILVMSFEEYNEAEDSYKPANMIKLDRCMLPELVDVVTVYE